MIWNNAIEFLFNKTIIHKIASYINKLSTAYIYTKFKGSKEKIQWVKWANSENRWS